jgi:hypothetical protein
VISHLWLPSALNFRIADDRGTDPLPLYRRAFVGTNPENAANFCTAVARQESQRLPAADFPEEDFWPGINFSEHP